MKISIRRALAALLMLVAAVAPAVAQFAGQSTYAGSSAGTANAQTITLPNVAALADVLGAPITFKVTTPNTGATTLAVNGLAATSVLKNSPTGLVALVGGEIAGVASALYDGTEFVLLNPAAIIAPGAVQAYNLSACPAGWTTANGANTTAPYNVDMRGQFARGLDLGAGVDPGRSLDTPQADQLQTFIATYTANVSTTTEGGGSGGTKSAANFQQFQAALSGANFGTETRPKNIALLYCVKL